MSKTKNASATSGEVPKVWVTKYALTDGVRLCECAELDDKYGWVKWPETFGVCRLMIGRKDIHHTIEAAQERAKFMAANKMGALEKQRNKMAKIARDGAKVVEEK
jgi:hypothetical protein